MRATRLIAISALALLAGPAQAEDADGHLISYEGRLEDADRKPIGGVFPLTFSIYKTPRAKKASWSESHFVAVDNGNYVVELGQQRALPPKLRLDRAYLGVAVTSGAEIVREKLEPKASEPAEEKGATASRTAEPTTARAPGGTVDYAENAGHAIEAEHAKVADKVGTLTADAIEEALKKAASSGGSSSVGSKTAYSASAGGHGGVAYELKCPKGQVVVGIRGGGGKYIDSVQLICSPLK